MRSRPFVIAMGLGWLVAFLGACGGSSSGQAAPRSSTTVERGDIAVASAAALTVADLPPGFSATRVRARTAKDVESARRFARCLGVSTLLVPMAPWQVRRRFVHGHIHIASDVNLFPSATALGRHARAYISDAAARCFGTVLTAELRSQNHDPNLHIGTVTATKLAVAVDADRAAAFRVTLPATTAGITVHEYVDLVVATRGRAATLFEAATPGVPYGAVADAELTNKVLARLPST